MSEEKPDLAEVPPISDVPEDTPKPKSNRRRLFILLAILVFSCAACGIISLFIPDSDRTPAEEIALIVEPTELATEEPEPTDPPPANTPSPTSTPEPTSTPTPLGGVDGLRNVLALELSRSNRGFDERISGITFNEDKGIISIGWNINDNLTRKMIRDGSKLDATKILKALSESDIDYDVVGLTGTFQLVNNLGETSEAAVIIATYDRTIIDRIVWENFLFTNVFDIAEGLYIHPSFEE